MNFTFRPERYDDGSGSDHWFSGIYKITKYESITKGAYTRRVFYRAYFKPVGWKNWGNSVDRTTTPECGYWTLEDAQKACKQHAEQWENPRENDRF